MNLARKTIVLTAGIMGSTLVAASTASVNMTNDKIQANVNLNMGSFGVNGGITQDNKRDVTSGHIGVNIQDRDTSGPLEIGIGVRLNVANADFDDEDKLTVALGLGGWYRYTLQDANRLSIYGSGYYSPEILSFSSNLERSYTYDLRFEYMTMRNARAYLRYGNNVIVYKDGTRREFNKGFSVGATVDF